MGRQIVPLNNLKIVLTEVLLKDQRLTLLLYMPVLTVSDSGLVAIAQTIKRSVSSNASAIGEELRGRVFSALIMHMVRFLLSKI